MRKRERERHGGTERGFDRILLLYTLSTEFWSFPTQNASRTAFSQSKIEIDIMYTISQPKPYMMHPSTALAPVRPSRTKSNVVPTKTTTNDRDHKVMAWRKHIV